MPFNAAVLASFALLAIAMDTPSQAVPTPLTASRPLRLTNSEFPETKIPPGIVPARKLRPDISTSFVFCTSARP
jgi:hypothetical protein